MQTILTDQQWISKLPDVVEVRPLPGVMFNSSPRDLTQEEKDLLTQMKLSGASETEIAKKLADLAAANVARGGTMLDETKGRSTEVDAMLRDLMAGKMSFTDDNVAQQQWKRAKDAAAGEFASAERVLADRYASRGLSGGGQQRGDLRKYTLNAQNKTLADQATDIYGQVAKQKSVERASALDAFMNNLNQERGLGLSLTGMGGQNYGTSGSQFQGVGANMGNALGSLTGRPQQQNFWSQLLGAATGGIGAYYGAKR